MTAGAVLVGAALLIAAPDLATVGGALCTGRRMPRAGWLLTTVVAVHTGLVVAVAVRGTR